MDVHLQFTQPFEGIVSSKGQYADPRCVYVPPSTGKTFFTFRIAYARCGTKPDLNGQFYENTVVVQYDKDLLEVWDEAKRLRCEWYNDYEKTASKPPMVIADLDVIQLDFRGECFCVKTLQGTRVRNARARAPYQRKSTVLRGRAIYNGCFLKAGRKIVCAVTRFRQHEIRKVSCCVFIEATAFFKTYKTIYQREKYLIAHYFKIQFVRFC